MEKNFGKFYMIKINAGVAQRLVHQFAILGMWFRLPSSAQIEL